MKKAVRILNAVFVIVLFAMLAACNGHENKNDVYEPTAFQSIEVEKPEDEPLAIEPQHEMQQPFSEWWQIPFLAQTRIADKELSSAYEAFYAILNLYIAEIEAVGASEYERLAIIHPIHYGTEIGDFAGFGSLEISFAGLIDFDNDGQPELVIIMHHDFWREGRYPIRRKYVVYGFSDGKIVSHFSAELNRGRDFVDIIEANDGRFYLVPWSSGGATARGTVYYTVVNNEWVRALASSFESTSAGEVFIVNGVQVSEDDWLNAPKTELGITAENSNRIDTWDRQETVQVTLEQLRAKLPVHSIYEAFDAVINRYETALEEATLCEWGYRETVNAKLIDFGNSGQPKLVVAIGTHGWNGSFRAAYNIYGFTNGRTHLLYTVGRGYFCEVFIIELESGRFVMVRVGFRHGGWYTFYTVENGEWITLLSRHSQFDNFAPLDPTIIGYPMIYFVNGEQVSREEFDNAPTELGLSHAWSFTQHGNGYVARIFL